MHCDSKYQKHHGKPKRFDLINRGSKKPSPMGSAVFIGLRMLDIPWQYHLLHNGAAESALFKVGLPAVTSGFPLTTGIALVDKLRLPFPRLLLLGMAAGSTVKQIYWQTCTSQEEFPVSAAVPVSVYNTVVNTACTMLFTCAYTSSWLSGPRMSLLGTELPLAVLLGSMAYVAGISIETGSEYQRKKFKQDPRNKGKVCKVGMWSLARHINYFGYALWRGGYAMTAGGWVIGTAMGLWQGWDFATRASVVLDDYCSDRYGEQWAQFKREVPYRIIPGIY